MIIIDRKINQSIVLELPSGDTIIVCVKSRPNSNSLRLGVQVPNDVLVTRNDSTRKFNSNDKSNA